MTKVKFLLALPLAAVILTGCTNVRQVGNVNGQVITRVTARGVFSPSSTTILAHDPGIPGVEVLANASGPGFIPAVATAGGIAGGAALLRPARSSTSVNNDNSSGSTSTSGNGSSITIPVAPRQHPNSPGNNGQPGNGGANNPNN